MAPENRVQAPVDTYSVMAQWIALQLPKLAVAGSNPADATDGRDLVVRPVCKTGARAWWVRSPRHQRRGARAAMGRVANPWPG